MRDLHSQFDHMHGPFEPITVTPNLEKVYGTTTHRQLTQVDVILSHAVIPSGHVSSPDTRGTSITRKFFIQKLFYKMIKGEKSFSIFRFKPSYVLLTLHCGLCSLSQSCLIGSSVNAPKDSQPEEFRD